MSCLCLQGLPPKGGIAGPDYDVHEWVIMKDWPTLQQLFTAPPVEAATPTSGAPPTTSVPEQGGPSQAEGVGGLDSLKQQLDKAAEIVAPYCEEG